MIKTTPFEMVFIIRDILIGNLEKKLGIPAGSFRHPNGRDMRSDKKLETLRKEQKKANKVK